MEVSNDLPVMILAAGRGNRLGKITKDIRKAMLPVGSETLFSGKYLLYIQ
jgi:choline kinase